MNCTQYTVLFITLLCKVYSVQCTVCSVQYTVYTVQTDTLLGHCGQGLFSNFTGFLVNTVFCVVLWWQGTVGVGKGVPLWNGVRGAKLPWNIYIYCKKKSVNHDIYIYIYVKVVP